MPEQHPNLGRALETLAKLEPRHVSFGYTAVDLIAEDGIAEAQLGYSVHADGTSLVGSEPGDWKSTWLVIATEDLAGDPIFIDLTGDEFPVFTAPHGEGTWEPELLATSLQAFGKALREVQLVSIGRQNPVELENNPLPDPDREALLERIEGMTGADSEFWAQWLETA
jgi:hypothetical protein